MKSYFEIRDHKLLYLSGISLQMANWNKKYFGLPPKCIITEDFLHEIIILK